MLSDPKVVRLLELLTDKQHTALEPVFAPRGDSWISYPAAEDVVDGGPGYAERLIKDLHRLGYLQKEFAESIRFCPACNSRDLNILNICPKCGSPHMMRRHMLEHGNCGYVGAEEDFGKDDNRVCPKCRVELVLIGTDYKSLGNRYLCGSCRAVEEEPVERYKCRSCGRELEQADVRELALYRYRLNQSQLSKLRVERIPKARVREFLGREGYEIQESVHAVGRSGAEHELDFLATKRSGPLEHRIVVGFASAEDEVDSEEVIKLYAKAYDVDAQDTILVASPRLSEDAQSFAKHYHIKVFDADQLSDPDLNLSLESKD